MSEAKTPEQVAAEKALEQTNKELKQAKEKLASVLATTNTEKEIQAKIVADTTKLKEDQAKEQKKLDTIISNIADADRDQQQAIDRRAEAVAEAGIAEVELKRIKDLIAEHEQVEKILKEKGDELAAAHEIDRKRIKGEITELEQKLATLRNDYEEEKKRIGKEKADATQQLAVVTAELTEKQGKVRNTTDVITKLDNQEKTLKHQVEVLEGKLGELNVNKDQIERDIRTKRTELVNVEEKIERAQELLKETQKEIEQINTTKFQLAKRKEELDEREAMLKEKFKQAGVPF